MCHYTTGLIRRFLLNQLCKVRGRTASQCGFQIAPRQPLYRRRRRADTLLHRPAGSHSAGQHLPVVQRLIDLSGDVGRGRLLTRVRFPPLRFGVLFLVRRDVLHLLRGRSGRRNLALRPRNIARLAADFRQQLRRLHPPLLFILIEDFIQPRIRTRRVAAQVRHVLRLLRLIADNEGAVAHRRLRHRRGAAAAVQPRQQTVRHVAFELAADAAAGAHAHALMLGFIVRVVLYVAEAQRAGVETVLIGGGGGTDDRAVQPGVLTRRHVKAAVPGKDAGLLGHALPVAVHLILAEVDACGAGHRAEGEAAARAGVLLLAVVAVAVLL